jgi:mannitol-1-phosphate/altronate dehydrogenase
MSDRIVVMGAGALALGFFGPELCDEYSLTLLDVSAKADLVERIRRRGSYTLNLAGADIEAKRVEPSHAFLLDDPAEEASIREHITQARIFFTAVGIRNFDKACAYIVERLHGRTDDVFILCAENGEGVTEAWRRRTPENIRFLDTVMGRMCRIEDQAAPAYVPVQPDLKWGVVAECFYGMPLTDANYDPYVFHSKAFQFVSESEFHARDRIKLFAHNGLHCFLAVQGRLKGKERFHDLAGDPEADTAARALLEEEIAPALWKECGPHVRRAYLRDYLKRLPDRLLSRTLRDQVARGVRGLADKFAPNERIIGGLRLLLRNGVKPDRFLGFIASALRVLDLDGGGSAVPGILAAIEPEDVREESRRRYEALRR